MSIADAAPMFSETQWGGVYQENDTSSGESSVDGNHISSSSWKPGSQTPKSRPGGIHAHEAAYEGDLVKLKQYVQAGGDLEKRDIYRATPLLLAAEKVVLLS